MATISRNISLALCAVVALLATTGMFASAFVYAEQTLRDGKTTTMFDTVDRQAIALAQRPFVPAPELPPSVAKLDYDGYHMIAFEHAEAIGKRGELPFWLECFHRGYLFREQVKLNLVADDRATPLNYERKLFQYRGALKDIAVPDDVGFAGFRILGRFEKSENPLETASFLGASYFRAIGEGQFYGTSARGLAVDVGMARAEEFPAFREFWIERPQRGDNQLRFWALLDSPALTGVYEFMFTPGEATAVDVMARLHFRQGVSKLGVAPLTSMWMWGNGRPRPSNDPRPKVHDADGLLVHTAAGEWIWRPLAWQQHVSVSDFDYDGIRGFGLLQRDRREESYRDDEAKYHLRPSVWIEPRKAWPAGAIELLEMPAPHEGIDNVAAWWTPRAKVDIKQPLDLAYTVTFRTSEPPEHNLARAVATRVVREKAKPARIEVDFAGESLASVGDDALTPQVECERGRVGEVRVARQTSGDWRLSFNIYPEGDAPLELRAVLRGEEKSLTETWRYLCPTKSE